MYHYLAEDPWPVAGFLGLLALGFLAALKMTQQGKYLIWAAIAFVLALIVIGVERYWVTDNERIEETVYGFIAAVEASDGEKAATFLAPEAALSLPNETLGGHPYFRAFLGQVASMLGQKLSAVILQDLLKNYKFDYIKVTNLTTRAGEMTRQGTAEFRVHVMATRIEPFHAYATPAAGMGWSFGLREMSPKVWKITRLTPTSPLEELEQQPKALPSQAR